MNSTPRVAEFAAIAKLAARRQKFGLELQDVAFDEVVDAAEDHDPRRGPFRPYAFMRACRRVIDHVRGEARRIRRQKLYMGLLPATVELDVRGLAIKQIVDRLPEREQSLFRLVDVEGYEPHEAAQLLGISRFAVCRSRKKLHRALSVLGDDR